MSSTSRSKQEEEEIVFEFWNSFKGGKTSVKRDPKTRDLICWHSHNKLTHDMRVAIAKNLKDYTLEEMCTAIHNYAEVLLGDKYFWTYVWPLSIFFSVKYEREKDGSKKWWKFLPENFDKQTYLKRGDFEEHECIVEDPDPSLTNMLITTFRKKRLCREGFVPSPKQVGQFRLASKKMIEFYRNRSCQDKKVWLEDLFECLEQNYLSKGEVVSVGLLCSDHLWDFLMPQLLRQCGRE